MEEQEEYIEDEEVRGGERKTDAGDSSDRKHNMLTVRQKHERLMSRKEMRREIERRRDSVETEII